MAPRSVSLTRAGAHSETFLESTGYRSLLERRVISLGRLPLGTTPCRPFGKVDRLLGKSSSRNKRDHAIIPLSSLAWLPSKEASSWSVL